MILSAQSIRRRCIQSNLIEPFVERGVKNGKSFGLSACTYDIRIAHDLIIPPIELTTDAWDNPLLVHKNKALAVSLEKFKMPNDLVAFVFDKSSYARVFVSAFNTLGDPGWQGHWTLELINLGDKEVVYEEGDPVCQIAFCQLDEPTEQPYKGKYQNQPMEPVPMRLEDDFPISPLANIGRPEA
jgi:dCTP deaminase